MSNINGYPEICDSCNQRRTCNDAGLCHECQQDDNDACLCVECGLEQAICACEGGPWIPGGYAL